MALTPVGRLKVALRAARRRRYAYAALRVFRGGLAGAVREELRRSIGPRPYASQREQIWRAYWRGLGVLRRRFPSLDLADPRSTPRSAP